MQCKLNSSEDVEKDLLVPSETMGVNKNKRPAEDADMKDVEKDVEMETSTSPPSAKKAKKASKKKNGILRISPMQPKNPVALLNELRQNLTFDLVSQAGPVHAPVFTMKVAVSRMRILCASAGN